MWLATSRGCPLGGVFSPHLWCLVVDNLLARLSGNRVFIQEYSDDICILAVCDSQRVIRTHAVGPSDLRVMVNRCWTVSLS
jgi:hypothetical protein